MITDALPLHLRGDLAVGRAQQIAGKDVLDRFFFLSLTDDFSVLNRVTERNFSLPSHLPHRPFHFFRQLQAIVELEPHLLC